MRIRRTECISLLLLGTSLSAGAFAQSGRWSPPALAYLYDADSKAIRLVAGVPGAALLELGVALPSKLEQAAVSPNRKFALVMVKDTDGMLLVNLQSGSTELVPLEGALLKPDLVTFSPSGATAAMFSNDSGHAQVWTGLPENPALLKEIDVASASSLAVSDDGSLLAVLSGSGLKVFSGEEGKTLTASSTLSAAVFFPASHDVAVADSAVDQILLFRDAGNESEGVTLVTQQNGLAKPIALAISADGRKLIAANARDNSILSLDVESRAALSFACECTVQGLDRAQGNSVFRLNTMGEQIAFFDGDSEQPRFFAVPTGGQQ